MQYNRKDSKNTVVAMFKDIRNIKRFQSYTINKDVMGSAKDLKNVRSTKLIDLTSFMDNKNEKMKNIDVKLEMHNTEIQKNHDIIDQLNHNFANLKEHLDKEREATLAEVKKNRLLREQNDKNNKMLRLKNSKIQEYFNRISELQKQNQDLQLKTIKIDEYLKTITALKDQIASMQEKINNLTVTITEKDQEVKKQKEKNEHMQAIKGKQLTLNQKLMSKDTIIDNLKQTIKDLTLQASKNLQEKNTISSKLLKFEAEINRHKEAAKTLSTTIQALGLKQNAYKYKLQSLQMSSKESQAKAKLKEQQQSSLRVKFNELKSKFNDLSILHDEKQKEIAIKDNKIDKMNNKNRQLQSCIGDNYKEKDKLKTFQDKFTTLTKKMQILQNAYYSIAPQIQCPFGHELKNAVTIIPCGHNYCLNCKKGYSKDCVQCNGKLKIEAVYRNELMDDIIGMVGAIKHIIEVLQ